MICRLLLIAFALNCPALVRAESTMGEIASVQQGGGSVVLPNGRTEEAKKGLPVPPGSAVQTGNGSVGVHLLPGANTVVAPNTQADIPTLDYAKDASGAAQRKVLVDLHQGTVFNTLVHGDGTSDFRVKTPKGVAAARGTDWSVSVHGGNVEIHVLNGNVLFFFGGHSIGIPAGHGFSTGLGHVFVLTPRQLQAIITALTEAGFPLSTGQQGNANGGGNGGGNINPATTTSPEE